LKGAFRDAGSAGTAGSQIQRDRLRRRGPGRSHGGDAARCGEREAAAES
jgi:hypothetical protein